MPRITPTVYQMPTSLTGSTAELLHCLLLAAALTGLSLAITGFQYGISNNIFHIPYVLRLAERPEFADDAFYGSLRHFTSVVWPLLRLWTNEGNAEWSFLLAHVASRFLAIAALLWLARLNTLRDRTALTVFGAAASCAMSWIEVSPVGHHGMFIGYFTHSEATWAPVFLALACLQTGKWVAAAVFLGLTFCINAFVAIWLACMVSIHLWHSASDIPRVRLALAALALLLTTLPVALWIGAALLESGAASPFSSRDYAQEYYPHHFLIEAASPRSLAHLLAYFATAWVAADFSPHPRFWRRIVLGGALVFLAGTLLPYVTDHRLVFNLHLLRSDGLIVALGIALGALAGCRLLFSCDRSWERLLGFVVLASLLTFRTDGLLSTLAGLAALWLGRPAVLPTLTQTQAVTDGGFLHSSLLRGGTLVLLLALSVLMNDEPDRPWTSSIASQLLLLGFGAWVTLRQGTPQGFQPLSLPATPLLLALAALNAAFAYNWHSAAMARQALLQAPWIEVTDWIRKYPRPGPFFVPLGREADSFQLLAGQTSWVNWKQGAAVMWSPSFYAQWHGRLQEARALKHGDEILAYAEAHAIPHVVLRLGDGTCSGRYRELMRNTMYVLCSAD